MENIQLLSLLLMVAVDSPSRISSGLDAVKHEFVSFQCLLRSYFLLLMIHLAEQVGRMLSVDASSLGGTVMVPALRLEIVVHFSLA